jgi:AraC-like DNA-binding protein
VPPAGNHEQALVDAGHPAEEDGIVDGPEVVEEMVSARPAAALLPFVGHYTGYRQHGIAPAVHRGLPSPYLTMIITLDDPLVISSHPDPGQPGGRFETLIGGLHTRPAMISHDGSQSGVQLALSPLGASSLLGLPAGALFALDVPAEVLLGPFVDELQTLLREAVDWTHRFAVLDRLLQRRLVHTRSDRVRAPAPEVAYAWRRLRATGGSVPISRLAAEVGWSTRYLGRRFGAELGPSPKAAARVVRFDRARWLVQGRVAAGRPLRLAEVAARCGYFDQAHLARDFRALAGCSPSAWAAEDIRNVQAHQILEEEG